MPGQLETTLSQFVKGTAPDIYLIEDAKRRWVPDPMTLDLLTGGEGLAAVRQVPDSELEAIPLGDPLPSLLGGSLYRLDGDEYLVLEDGELRPIADEVAVSALGGRSAAVQVDEDVIHLLESVDAVADQPFVLTEAENQARLREYIQQIPKFGIEGSGVSTLTLGDPINDSMTLNGIQYAITEKRKRIQADIAKFSVVDPVESTLYPGSALQGRTLETGLLAPIPLRRGPGTLTVTTDLIHDSGSLGGNLPRSASQRVEEPSLASIRDTRTRLLFELDPIASTGRTSYDWTVARTVEKGFLELGVNLKGASWAVDVSGRLDKSLETNTLMFKFIQTFYTVAFVPDGSPPRFFDDSVRVEDLEDYSDPANPPCYLSEVSYGRQLVLMVQAAESVTNIRAAVAANWDAAVSGNVQLKAAYDHTIQKSEVKFISVGSDGNANLNLIQNPAAGLFQYLRNGINLSTKNPGAPISFTASYMRDSTIAAVRVQSQEYRETVSASAPPVTTQIDVWDEQGKGVPGGVDTQISVAPGDVFWVDARGTINAGWLFGSSFGPQGDTSDHGESFGNIPLPYQPFSALLYGFGGPWNLVYPKGESPGPKTYPSDRPPGKLLLTVNDDNVQNGTGAFHATINVRRRELPGVGET